MLFDLMTRPADNRVTDAPFGARLAAANQAATTLAEPRFETMETRLLLDVTAGEFTQIRNLYPDLNLSADMAAYNVIEITANQLSDTGLRNAVAAAAQTVQDDLIVIRTDWGHSVIDLGNALLSIHINSSQFGGVTIVSLGSEKLWIQGTSAAGVVGITGGDVALGGMVLNGIHNALTVDDVLRTAPTVQMITSQLIRTVERDGPAGNYSAFETCYASQAVSQTVIYGPAPSGGAKIGVKTYDVTVPVGGTLYAYVAGLSLAERNAVVGGSLNFLNQLEPYDAEKALNGKDENHCWSASMSNVLAYTGWGNINGFQTEDDIFNYFVSHFTNSGAQPYYASEWFLTGKYSGTGLANHAQIVIPGGGFYPTVTYASVAGWLWTHQAGVTFDGLTTAVNKLKLGSGISITVDLTAASWPTGTTHAQTLWGVVYDTAKTGTPGYYVSLLITDSGNSYAGGVGAPNVLQNIAITWDPSAKSTWLPTYGAYTMYQGDYGSAALLIDFCWLDKRPTTYAVPQQFVSTGKTASTASFAWDPVSGVTGFEILWRVSGTSSWNTHIVSGPTATTTTISLPKAGTTYEFQIRAVNGAERSTWSPVVSVKTEMMVPTSVSVSEIGFDRATLSWTAVPGASGYYVAWYSGNTMIDARTVSGDTLSVEITGLKPGTKYTFRVYTNLPDDQRTPNYAKASAKTRAVPPPQSVKGTSADALGAIELTWNPPKAKDLPANLKVIAYNIYNAANELVTTVTPINGIMSFRMENLSPKTKYTYRVTVVYKPNAGGDEIESKPVTVKVKTRAFTAPKLLKARAGDKTLDSVTLRWQPHGDIDTFVVTCLAPNKLPMELIFAGPNTNAAWLYENDDSVSGNIIGVKITGLTAGTKYTFTVCGTSDLVTVPSATARRSVATVKFPAMKKVKLEKSSLQSDAAALTWTPIALPRGATEGLVTYEVYYSETRRTTSDPTGWTLLESAGVSVTFTETPGSPAIVEARLDGLTPGRTYYIYVRAIWIDGDGKRHAATVYSCSKIVTLAMPM